jgi:hypothetical protein
MLQEGKKKKLELKLESNFGPEFELDFLRMKIHAKLRFFTSITVEFELNLELKFELQAKLKFGFFSLLQHTHKKGSHGYVQVA